MADSGLDSDKGSFINGGTVVALGSTMDWPESDSGQVTINLQFTDAVPYGSTIYVKDKNGINVFEHKVENETNLATDRQYRGVILSCAEFQQDAEYTLYVNDVQQGYYGSDIKMPGRKPDGNFPPMPEGDMRSVCVNFGRIVVNEPTKKVDCVTSAADNTVTLRIASPVFRVCLKHMEIIMSILGLYEIKLAYSALADDLLCFNK